MTIRTLFWSFFKLCSSSWIPWYENWASTRCKSVLIFFPVLSMHRCKQSRTNFIKLLFIYFDNRPFISRCFPGLKIYKPYLKSSRHGVHDELLKWRNIQKRVSIVTYVHFFVEINLLNIMIQKNLAKFPWVEEDQSKPIFESETRFCLFGVLCPTRVFFIWKSYHCRWRAANFDLCSALMAIERATPTVTRGICL